MGWPGEGIEGNVPATYGGQSNTDYNVYFGGKLIWAEASAALAARPVGADRLGSVAWRNGTANRYFPYGQEAAATGQDCIKFATYYRDETTSFDYARNRYYNHRPGRRHINHYFLLSEDTCAGVRGQYQVIRERCSCWP
ncbi:MAG: hypothetical protein IT159_00170 [Bryobacterales bacterium]|jgi:hypothetical protein|nr:hypothetical protein [Bryobacterales bacterium]